MTAGRPTKETEEIRAEFQRMLRQQTDELNAKHQQVVKFYQDRAAEDAQTISELAAKVETMRVALQMATDWIENVKKDAIGRRILVDVMPRDDMGLAHLHAALRGEKIEWEVSCSERKP